MKNYKLFNNLLGWMVFLIASAVYIITSEPTASFWDCGEYISTAFKLQVGHPPGAPFFQLFGRFFSLFAFGNVHLVARMVNTMSALMSGGTIMFLFWTITALARKLKMNNEEESSVGTMWAVLAAGLVGALAYTFTDSFWFSAVEGEVYATSSFFTAIVFWAILKWEAVADETQSWRWIILIAFLMGLSVGVHLLNLLTIPAMTFVYYFRKFKVTKWGVLLTLAISVLLLAALMYGIIPQVVYLFARTELIFVNKIGLPFNSGTIFFALLIVVFIAAGLWYTSSKGKISGLISVILGGLLVVVILMASTSVGDFLIRLLICGGLVTLAYFGRHHYAVLKTTILSLAFILIGYSTFLTLVIRSNSETPLNENAPKDAISLLSYLNREQYGSWPLVYGQYYCAPLDSKEPYLDGSPIYGRDDKAGKYVVVDDRKATIPNYDDKFCTLFPRMWSNQQKIHISGYKSWADVTGTPITVTGYNGKPQTIYRPTFVENVKFFFRYQLGFMYFRYFMWNFAGRQNDIQGYGGNQNGNWISGISFLDKMRLGPQTNLPDYMENNRGRNRFYFLPLLLGLCGFIFQLNKSKRGLLIIGLLFLFTGIAINIYLNIAPYQPRERDYAYAASFYAFAIWIGFGVLMLYSLLRKWMKGKLAAILSFIACFLLVPFIMAKEGWGDHDRSGRYTVVDMASDYLNSCAPNAILFTLGDNDTFPLWYAQEVEGIRTDVRVVNLSLLNTDWYIDQVKKKAYDSEPVPITIPRDKYIGSKREITYMYEDTVLVPKNAFVDLSKILEFATSDDKRAMLQTYRGDENYFPTANFSLPVDSVWAINSGLVPKEYKDSVPSRIYFVYDDYGVQKNSLMVLDLLAHFEWKRPVYFAITTGEDSYMGLQDYFRMEGLAFRLVPYRCISIDNMVGRVNTDIMYDNMMNKFKWGNMSDPHVYIDETNARMILNLRNTFSRLAFALVYENKLDSAVKVCDRCVEVMPNESIPFDKMLIPLIDVYFRAGKIEKANQISNILLDRYEQELIYFSQFSGADAAYLDSDMKEASEVIKTIGGLAQNYKQDVLFKKAVKIYEQYPSK
jgi:hypothetical protein